MTGGGLGPNPAAAAADRAPLAPDIAAAPAGVIGGGLKGLLLAAMTSVMSRTCVMMGGGGVQRGGRETRQK